MKYPYVVYWHNKHNKKWQVCVSLDKANKLVTLLKGQGIQSIWLAKDI